MGIFIFPSIRNFNKNDTFHNKKHEKKPHLPVGMNVQMITNNLCLANDVYSGSVVPYTC